MPLKQKSEPKLLHNSSTFCSLPVCDACCMRTASRRLRLDEIASIRIVGTLTSTLGSGATVGGVVTIAWDVGIEAAAIWGGVTGSLPARGCAVVQELCDSAAVGDAMTNAAIAAISVRLVFLIMVILIQRHDLPGPK